MARTRSMLLGLVILGNLSTGRILLLARTLTISM